MGCHHNPHTFRFLVECTLCQEPLGVRPPSTKCWSIVHSDYIYSNGVCPICDDVRGEGGIPVLCEDPGGAVFRTHLFKKRRLRNSIYYLCLRCEFVFMFGDVPL